MARRNLIDTKIEEAIEILRKVCIPVDGMSVRRQRRVALSLLALAKMKPDTSWKEASVFEGPESWKLTTRETISFWNKYWFLR